MIGRTTNRLLYQHAYHAGNYADVIKHTVLIMALQHMKKKPSPFSYVETHSGAGAYPLSSEEALRLGEHERGIEALRRSRGGFTSPQAIETLFNVMDQLSLKNKDCGGEVVYPGSPSLAASLCREGDSILLCEQAPDQCELLRRRIGCDPRARIVLGDGYKELKQRENYNSQQRSLVFIDPPYQFGSETERIASLTTHLRKHWRSARVAIWHPVSERNQDKTERLQAMVREAALEGDDILAVECKLPGGDGEDPLDVGSGLLMVNPPFGMDDDLRRVLPEIGAAISGRGGEPDVRVEFI